MNKQLRFLTPAILSAAFVAVSALPAQVIIRESRSDSSQKASQRESQQRNRAQAARLEAQIRDMKRKVAELKRQEARRRRGEEPPSAAREQTKRRPAAKKALKKPSDRPSQGRRRSGMGMAGPRGGMRGMGGPMGGMGGMSQEDMQKMREGVQKWMQTGKMDDNMQKRMEEMRKRFGAMGQGGTRSGGMAMRSRPSDRRSATRSRRGPAQKPKTDQRSDRRDDRRGNDRGLDRNEMREQIQKRMQQFMQGQGMQNRGGQGAWRSQGQGREWIGQLIQRFAQGMRDHASRSGRGNSWNRGARRGMRGQSMRGQSMRGRMGRGSMMRGRMGRGSMMRGRMGRGSMMRGRMGRGSMMRGRMGRGGMMRGQGQQTCPQCGAPMQNKRSSRGPSRSVRTQGRRGAFGRVSPRATTMTWTQRGPQGSSHAQPRAIMLLQEKGHAQPHAVHRVQQSQKKMQLRRKAQKNMKIQKKASPRGRQKARKLGAQQRRRMSL